MNARRWHWIQSAFHDAAAQREAAQLRGVWHGTVLRQASGQGLPARRLRHT